MQARFELQGKPQASADTVKTSPQVFHVKQRIGCIRGGAKRRLDRVTRAPYNGARHSPKISAQISERAP